MLPLRWLKFHCDIKSSSKKTRVSWLWCNFLGFFHLAHTLHKGDGRWRFPYPMIVRAAITIFTTLYHSQRGKKRGGEGGMGIVPAGIAEGGAWSCGIPKLPLEIAVLNYAWVYGMMQSGVPAGNRPRGCVVFDRVFDEGL